ncbi:MAG TPA: hypothetical protein VE985_10460, partial [Gaiellaceae bacterium]|nr:hypothetical protein [Gaiellaceae bacterium]
MQPASAPPTSRSRRCSSAGCSRRATAGCSRRHATRDRALLQTHHSADDLRRHSAEIGREFLVGFEAVERIDRPAVSCFGSARAPEDSLPYRLAR